MSSIGCQINVDSLLRIEPVDPEKIVSRFIQADLSMGIRKRISACNLIMMGKRE